VNLELLAYLLRISRRIVGNAGLCPVCGQSMVEPGDRECPEPHSPPVLVTDWVAVEGEA